MPFKWPRHRGRGAASLAGQGPASDSESDSEFGAAPRLDQLQAKEVQTPSEAQEDRVAHCPEPVTWQRMAHTGHDWSKPGREPALRCTPVNGLI